MNVHVKRFRDSFIDIPSPLLKPFPHKTVQFGNGKIEYFFTYTYKWKFRGNLVAVGDTEGKSKSFEKASRAICLGVRASIFPTHETVVIKTMPVYKKVVNDRGADAE